MTTEVQNIEEDIPSISETPPIVDLKLDAKPKNGKREPAREATRETPSREKPREKENEHDDEDDFVRGTPKMSGPLRDIQRAEDVALRDWFGAFGLAEGAFRLSIMRLEPKMVFDPKTGSQVKVDGHLATETSLIDEADLQARYGGGKYKVKVLVPNKEGKFVYLKSRDLDIAGDPRTDSIPRNFSSESSKPAAPAATADSPTVVSKAFDMMERQIEHSRQAAAHANAPDQGPVIEILRAELASRTEEIRAIRAELIAAQNKTPPKDEIKDKLLESLLDGESGRITGIRTQFESEIRTLKSNHDADIARLRDQHDRDRERDRQNHERELTTLRQQHELTVQTIKTSHEVAMAAAKSSYEINTKLFDAHNRQLDKDNTRLEVEVKELRAKKEKSIVEQLTEIEKIKEAFGDDDKEESAADKIVNVLTDPGTIAFATRVFGKGGPATGTPAAVAAQPQKPQFKRQVVKAADGKSYLLESDGQMRGPVRKKGSVPGEPELPNIPPEQVAAAVAFLENAFTKASAPTEVAQSVKMMISVEISQAIATLGIDLFMQKVAKLPASSPLANQKGRNWIRAVAKELT